MQYTLMFVQDRYAKNIDEFPILLIEKDRPEWQQGRYNLPGGKIEPGEIPLVAAIRELIEEAGDWALGSKPEQMGMIKGAWGEIYCFRTIVDEIGKDRNPEKEEETERLFWTHWKDVKEHPRLLPNLRVIIPLMITGQKNWTVIDQGPTFKTDRHSFIVDVQSTLEQYDEDGCIINPIDEYETRDCKPKDKLKLMPSDYYYKRAMARSAEIKQEGGDGAQSDSLEKLESYLLREYRMEQESLKAKLENNDQ